MTKKQMYYFVMSGVKGFEKDLKKAGFDTDKDNLVVIKKKSPFGRLMHLCVAPVVGEKFEEWWKEKESLDKK